MPGHPDTPKPNAPCLLTQTARPHSRFTLPAPPGVMERKFFTRSFGHGRSKQCRRGTSHPNVFKNFVLLLLMVFTPWSVINLVDYYKISRDRLDIPALYNPDGRYGRWNAAALVSYGIGVVVQIPFLAQALYTGPVTRWLGGADISWLVGIAATLAIYYPWAKATNRAPAVSIYPDSSAESLPLPAGTKA